MEEGGEKITTCRKRGSAGGENRERQEGRSRGRCLNSAWGCWTGDILLPKPGRCDTAGFHVQVLRLASCFSLYVLPREDDGKIIGRTPTARRPSR